MQLRECHCETFEHTQTHSIPSAHPGERGAGVLLRDCSGDCNTIASGFISLNDDGGSVSAHPWDLC
jgi:hypothetical protein